MEARTREKQASHLPRVIPPPSFYHHTLWTLTPPVPVCSQQHFLHMSNREMCVFKTLRRGLYTNDARQAVKGITAHFITWRRKKTRPRGRSGFYMQRWYCWKCYLKNRVSHTNEMTRCWQAPRLRQSRPHYGKYHRPGTVLYYIKNNVTIWWLDSLLVFPFNVLQWDPFSAKPGLVNAPRHALQGATEHPCWLTWVSSARLLMLTVTKTEV